MPFNFVGPMFWFALAISTITSGLVSYTCQAQIVDLQSEVNKKAPAGASGVISGSYDRRTGQTDLTAGAASLLLRYRYDAATLLGIYRHEQGQKSGEEHLNNSFQHLRLRYDLGDLWAAEAFGQADYDRYRGFVYRKLFGAGPVARWIDTEDMSLYTGLAAMQEVIFYTAEASPLTAGEREKTTTRLSLAVSYQQAFSDTLKGNLSMYYQPSTEEPKDKRLSGTAGFAAAIAKSLSFTTQVSVTRDTQPPLGFKETDLRIKNGLKFTF